MQHIADEAAPSWARFRIIVLVYVVTFLFYFGDDATTAPRTAIYESIICQHVYIPPGRSTTPLWNLSITRSQDRSCKTGPVQGELAYVQGIEQLLQILPTVLAVPFGLLADKHGRSLVLAIALLGVFLQDSWRFWVCWNATWLPLRLVWINVAFNVIGGGGSVIGTLLHLIIADIVAGEARARVFLRLQAAAVVAPMLAYATSSFIMERVSSWVAWSLGLSASILAICFALLIPNMSLKIVESQGSQDVTHVQSDSTTNVSQNSRESGSRPSTILRGPTMPEKLRAGVEDVLRSSRHVLRLISQNPQVTLLLCLSFTAQLGRDSLFAMTIIYLSKRFGWEFYQANYVNSLSMLVDLVTLLVILPALGAFLTSKLQYTAQSRDRSSAQISTLALCIGALFVALPSQASIAVIGFAVMGLGGGISPLLRSLVTDTVSVADLSTAYSLFTVMKIIGRAVGGPIYSGLYIAGMKLTARTGVVIWLGLPFMFAAAVFALALFGLFGVAAKRRYERVPDSDTEHHRD